MDIEPAKPVFTRSEFGYQGKCVVMYQQIFLNVVYIIYGVCER